MTVTARFALERSTKRKLVFQEVDGDDAPVYGDAAKVGTFYLSKTAFSNEPKRITVSIDEAG